MEELKLFELITDYDRLILVKESDLQKFFFNNVGENDISGNIELPLVYDENSDYAKLKTLKKEYEGEIQFINKKIQFPEKYLLPEVIDKLSSLNLSEDLLEKEKNKLLEISLKKQQKRRDKYEYRLKSIDEDPKLYIRFNELINSDFSKISDPEVREKLVQKSNEIRELKERRNELLESIKNKDITPRI